MANYYKSTLASGGGVAPTGDATVADVLAGKTFSNADSVGLTGTMVNRGSVGTQTLTPSTTSYTIPQGYHNGNGKVQISTQEKSVTATTSTQNVTPDSGKVLSKVTVNPQNHTATYTPTSRAAALDMGANNNNRYVNTNSVPNTNSGTYTFASGDTGGTKDLGETNTYRYVNAANVYAKGKADGATSISGTKTISTTGTTTVTTGSKPKRVTLILPNKYVIIYDSSISTTTYIYISTGNLGYGTANLNAGPELSFNVTNSGFTVSFTNTWYEGTWTYSYA